MFRDFLAVFFGVGTWAEAQDRKKREAAEAARESANVAEAHGNRTHPGRRESAPNDGFEDRERHQPPSASAADLTRPGD